MQQKGKTDLPGKKNIAAATASGKSAKIGFPAQFKLKRWRPDENQSSLSEDEAEGQKGAKRVSDEVDTAHEELLEGDVADATEKFQSLYLLRLKEYKEGKKTMHPSTAAGYIVESKVTKRLSGLANFDFQNAKLMKGTRPDVVITLKSGNKALIDITASGSLTHIFNKKGNWTNHTAIPYVAEAWYPTIDFDGDNVKMTEEQEKAAMKIASERKLLKDQEEAEAIAYKTEKYMELQKNIFDYLFEIPKDAVVYLGQRPRDIVKLHSYGIDIEGRNIVKMNITARNKKLGLTEEVTDSDLLPRFHPDSESMALVYRVIKKAVNVINLRKPTRKIKVSKLKAMKEKKKQSKAPRVPVKVSTEIVTAPKKRRAIRRHGKASVRDTALAGDVKGGKHKIEKKLVRDVKKKIRRGRGHKRANTYS